MFMQSFWGQYLRNRRFFDFRFIMGGAVKKNKTYNQKECLKVKRPAGCIFHHIEG